MFLFNFQGVRSSVVGGDTKSNLDNIVGSLWQARQESSGSSVGNQVTNNFATQIFSPPPLLHKTLLYARARIIRSKCAIIQTIFHVITIQVIRIPGKGSLQIFSPGSTTSTIQKQRHKMFSKNCQQFVNKLDYLWNKFWWKPNKTAVTHLISYKICITAWSCCVGISDRVLF